MTDVTRRKIFGAAAGTLAGAAAATAAAQPAQPAPRDPADVALFVKLSAALTGIAEGKLAPAVDPVQVKNDYYDQAKSDPGFAGLMQIIRADPSNPTAAADKVMNNADAKIKFLGRSIILAWYLGAWYPPVVLQQPAPNSPIPPLKVISSAAYTQAWAYRVAQAHPMGYSELRFGYWSDEPLRLTDFVA
jgi:hypothetical protein